MISSCTSQMINNWKNCVRLEQRLTKGTDMKFRSEN